MGKKCLWLAVSADKYELPFAVETTARELGEKLGVTAQTVKTLATLHKENKASGRNKKRKVVRIDL